MEKQLKNKKVLVVLIGVCIVLVAALSVFIHYKTGLKVVSSRETPTSFQVQPGKTSETILDKLQTRELIRNKVVTKPYMKFHGLSDIKAGNFKLDARWDTPKIPETLNDSKQANADDAKIISKEGMWAKGMTAPVEKQTGVKAGEPLALWNDNAYLNTLIKKHSFLSKDILNAQCKVKPEGYLCPETYSFHKDAAVKQIAETFLNQFQKAIAPYETDVRGSRIGMQEAITLASIVQCRASTEEDMEVVVDVFQNRLKQGMTLDGGITACYALCDDITSDKDCEAGTHIDSPYNTYKNAGPPIGPILDPGAMAIQVVLHPKANGYLYFVADIYGDGKMYYARTLDKQEVSIDKYNLRKQMKTMKKTILIGIMGGSASGRISISAQLKEYYEDTNFAVITRQDDYYRGQSEKTMEERIRTNYDYPFAFNNELLAAQLQRLLQRQPICKPMYDFVHHTGSEVIEEIEPNDVVVTEGLFILKDEDLRNLCGIEIFVDIDADVRLTCRLLRDVNERGRTLESVMEQYTSTIRDMHNLFIEPSKRYADVVTLEDGHNTVAIDSLVTRISNIISENVV